MLSVIKYPQARRNVASGLKLFYVNVSSKCHASADEMRSQAKIIEMTKLLNKVGGCLECDVLFYTFPARNSPLTVLVSRGMFHKPRFSLINSNMH